MTSVSITISLSEGSNDFLSVVATIAGTVVFGAVCFGGALAAVPEPPFDFPLCGEVAEEEEEDDDDDEDDDAEDDDDEEEEEEEEEDDDEEEELTESSSDEVSESPFSSPFASSHWPPAFLGLSPSGDFCVSSS